ncbi:starch-binding protein [Arachidicoccus ginsenosidimutans]|uniref:RagB/SusD family nutrient uptake outer membrane protein n=1 Tax=Arachidicoccus sp. BS20 TaxID=1850526 RepID=UPI0007F06FA3|nr:RagB/SusD family nutrient uptake outer membrane protein [Arachidicoccus sp. BS20]ANI90385.1 starch-binding protein [Arachidicoccus sp. BS20]
MKYSNKINGWWLPFLLMAFVMISSCKKFLDKTPLSNITPDDYLNDESQLSAYVLGQYPSVLPGIANYSFGSFGIDANTDNMSGMSMDNKYAPGLWLVGATGGDWDFTTIYQLNYFLETVLPKWTSGKITGDADNIKHDIGEIYFLRAYVYFNKLQALGDFPILRTTLPDNKDTLTVESKRQPCSEVARFILSDLDSAITLLKDVSPDGKKNRISKACAELFKSRVALYEGTWLKYFKGTAFVPNGPNWPGAGKDYNANYQFQSGSIDNEIQYFLGEAMSAAKLVADAVPLVSNTGIIQSPNNENPYFSMFGAVDMSGYGEVLLWRQYSKALGLTHNVQVYEELGNDGIGTTRSMVESFLMSNGLPIYAAGSGYQGDDSIQSVKIGRDDRLQLFLKQPGDTNVLLNTTAGDHATVIEPIPEIWVSSAEQKYTTGYAIRKGLNYDGAQAGNGQGYTGLIIFRAVEAYLNYIEACYEKNGSLDGDARNYWTQIRERAKVSTDVDKTIAATNMSEETGDWGAYSAGKLIDPTLYNIRRERRDELMAEGLRFMDLKRWRALDQLITTPAHIEGFKLWGPMKNWYTSSELVYGASNSAAVVSDPALSPYLRPYEILGNSTGYNGVKWTMAHYLSPIAAEHFTITAQGDDLSTSPIYQNPGWSTQAGTGATD